jgi:protease-4
MDPVRAMTDDERGAVEREIDGMYRAFLNVVARGRDQPIEHVEKVAEGRVWTGAAAASKRLVDTLGGFDEALASARRLAGDRSLEPAVLRAPRGGIPPLDPPAQAARLALTALGVDPGMLGLSNGREQVFCFSEIASWIR